MLVQVVDALRQQRDLHLGGTGVAFVLCVGGNDFSFGHVLSCPPYYSGTQLPRARSAVGEVGRLRARFI